MIMNEDDMMNSSNFVYIIELRHRTTQSHARRHDFIRDIRRNDRTNMRRHDHDDTRRHDVSCCHSSMKSTRENFQDIQVQEAGVTVPLLYLDTLPKCLYLSHMATAKILMKMWSISPNMCYFSVQFNLEQC